MLVFFFFSGIGGQPTSVQPDYPDFTPPAAPTDQVLAGRVIVVDPGHGGADPGTLGLGYSTEAENVLAIALDLKGMLEATGATVIMTREGNVSPAAGTIYANQTNGQLAARTALANQKNGDIFVSIHNDWNPTSTISGTTSYYYKNQDYLLAESIQEYLVGYLGSRDVGVRRGNFYVLRNTNMPAVLVEVGFLSNQRDAQLLSQPWYRSLAAEGIFYGILDYYKQAGIIR